jgi:hypothetical protein
MATNDFQTFAAGGGANVLTQAQYLALTSILANGFSAGVAPSAQLNKVWRQSSIMSAVLAQFTSDYSGQNSTDDGTTATLETNLIAAIRSVTKTSVILADTGAANAYTATNVPALTSGAWIDGVVQQVKIAHANTGASTYAPDGLTAIPIYGLGLQPLQGGELALNGTAVLMHATIAGVNSGNPIAILMECAGGAQQVALATKLLHAPEAGQVQQAAFNYAGLAGGTANALTATLSVAPGSYTDWLVTTARVAANNTGGTSLNVNGLGVVPVIGGAHQPLQGGELVAGGFATFAYSTNYSEAILLESTGGAMQVGAATQPLHAVQFEQLTGLVGSIRNAKMSVTTASATATFTADQIVVGTALNGLEYLLPSYSQAINLATTGVGGMDTGTAPTSGFVALYAIYNPTTQSTSIIATNASSAAVPNVYGAGHMPAGYTASALVSIWATNGSGQFTIGSQRDRKRAFPSVALLSTSAVAGSYTSFTSSAIPNNAESVQISTFVNNTTASSSMQLNVASDGSGSGQQNCGGFVTAGNALNDNGSLLISTALTLYYSSVNNNAGAPTFNISIVGFTF